MNQNWHEIIPTTIKPRIRLKLGRNKKKAIPQSAPFLLEPEVTETFCDFLTLDNLLGSLDGMFEFLSDIKPWSHPFAKIVKAFGPFLISLDSHEKVGDDQCISSRLENPQVFGWPSFLIWARMCEKDGSPDSVNQILAAVKTDRCPFAYKKTGVVFYQVQHMLHRDGRVYCPPDVYIACEKDGTINALRSPQTFRASNRKNGSFLYSQTRWQMPDIGFDRYEGTTSSERKAMLEEDFCFAYNFVMKREANINIVAEKGGDRCTFTVPPNRWKHFFSTRIDAPTETGRKRPIFHAVTSHMRKTKKGNVPVRTHYRGSRHFFFKGASIRILLPGLHGSPQSSLNVTTTDVYKPGSFSPDKKAAQINSCFGID